MSEAETPSEESGESGLWIVTKVAIFIAIPVLAVYVIKLLLS